VNYYNLARLNPNLKKKIRYQLTFFSGTSFRVFFDNFNDFYFILLESTIV